MTQLKLYHRGVNHPLSFSCQGEDLTPQVRESGVSSIRVRGTKPQPRRPQIEKELGSKRYTFFSLVEASEIGNQRWRPTMPHRWSLSLYSNTVWSTSSPAWSPITLTLAGFIWPLWPPCCLQNMTDSFSYHGLCTVCSSLLESFFHQTFSWLSVVCSNITPKTHSYPKKALLCILLFP